MLQIFLFLECIAEEEFQVFFRTIGGDNQSVEL